MVIFNSYVSLPEGSFFSEPHFFGLCHIHDSALNRTDAQAAGNDFFDRRLDLLQRWLPSPGLTQTLPTVRGLKIVVQWKWAIFRVCACLC